MTADLPSCFAPHATRHHIDRVALMSHVCDDMMAYILHMTRCPCRSASNYILGLTPLPLPAFMGGTVIGMGIWSVVYASIGGAGRSVLRSGVGLDTLLAGASHASEATILHRPLYRSR